jgi:ElaB/YqjD/DUF883 family membrane-anchored ribosome-binding protein
MTNPREDLKRTGNQSADEAAQLRRQLSNLVKEVRCTIADPARPENLKQALAQSQEMLR